VEAAVKAGMLPQQAAIARRMITNRIEDAGLARAKEGGIEPARTLVVTLYNGAMYHLYTYKKYTDVRLVFAPEQQAAFFGGDPDIFTYPRHDLDMALFRVYEDGKPIESKDYLKWNPKGAKDEELVFVAGHPGSTSRLDTLAQLEVERDLATPS